MKRLVSFAIVGSILLLSSCGTYQSTSTYSREQIGRAATVMPGVVISLREVDIQGTGSGVGAGAGAIAGGTAGSRVGGDVRTKIIGAVGGAVAGGLVGSAIENGVTQAKATEFIIKQDNGQTFAVVQSNEEGLKAGDRILVLRSDKVRLIKDVTVKVGP